MYIMNDDNFLKGTYVLNLITFKCDLIYKTNILECF